LKIRQEGKAGSKQYCYTDFEVGLDGKWTASTMYSNGRQIDPGRFYSLITIKAKDGKTIITIPQNHHVKGSHGGSAREERTTETGKLPQKVVTMIDKKKTTYNCRTVSDINLKNLQTVVEVAKWVLAL